MGEWGPGDGEGRKEREKAEPKIQTPRPPEAEEGGPARRRAREGGRELEGRLLRPRPPRSIDGGSPGLQAGGWSFRSSSGAGWAPTLT